MIRQWTPWAAVILFGILFTVERLNPLRKQGRSAIRRVSLNAGATALALGTAAFTVAPVISSVSAWTGSHKFGLLYTIPLPWPAVFICGILHMDLTFYYWHRLNPLIS